jgi:hypothetical protein
VSVDKKAINNNNSFFIINSNCGFYIKIPILLINAAIYLVLRKPINNLEVGNRKKFEKMF